MSPKLATVKATRRRPTRANSGAAGKSKKPARKKRRPTVIEIGGVKVVLQEPVQGGNISRAAIRKAVKETIEARIAKSAEK